MPGLVSAAESGLQSGPGGFCSYLVGEGWSERSVQRVAVAKQARHPALLVGRESALARESAHDAAEPRWVVARNPRRRLKEAGGRDAAVVGSGQDAGQVRPSPV